MDKFAKVNNLREDLCKEGIEEIWHEVGIKFKAEDEIQLQEKTLILRKYYTPP